MTGDVLESRQVHHVQDPERGATWEFGLCLANSGEPESGCKAERQGPVRACRIDPGSGKEVSSKQQLRRRGRKGRWVETKISQRLWGTDVSSEASGRRSSSVLAAAACLHWKGSVCTAAAGGLENNAHNRTGGTGEALQSSRLAWLASSAFQESSGVSLEDVEPFSPRPA